MNHIALHLRKIFLNKMSGILTFKRQVVEKRLFFLEGDLVNAKTNVPEERLGEILFKLGKISDEAHSELERYIVPHQAIGKALTKKGFTSQRNVVDGLTYQLREISLGLFPYFDADIAFQETVVSDDQGFAARLSVPYLIEDGIRRMKYHSTIQKFLEQRIPFQRDRAFVHLLTQEEKEMYSQITGSTTSDALWRSVKYNPEFFWKTMYLFYGLNLIDFTDREEKAAAEEKPKVEEPLQADMREKLEEVMALKEKLPSLSYYQILGVAKNASDDDIKKAYFHLARKFHPDRFDRSISPEDRAQIEDVFDKITKAYHTLTSGEQRKEYDVKMPAVPDRGARDVGKEADHKFRQAKTLFTMGRYEDALIYLEEATRLNKNKGSYFLLLAMTEVKIPTFRKKAEQHFLKAQELEPWNAEAYAGLGMLYKQEGMAAKATRQFQKALELDGDHAVARKEIGDLIGAGKKGRLKSLLSKNIFGSKKK
jgi:tetratricopeptide (TPR) repeat protein